ERLAIELMAGHSAAIRRERGVERIGGDGRGVRRLLVWTGGAVLTAVRVEPLDYATFTNRRRVTRRWLFVGLATIRAYSDSRHRTDLLDARKWCGSGVALYWRWRGHALHFVRASGIVHFIGHDSLPLLC